MTAPAPLTLIVEGKPLVFDVPVPVGEVAPADAPVAYLDSSGTWAFYERAGASLRATLPNQVFRARCEPSGSESVVEGDVAWVPFKRNRLNLWTDPGGGVPIHAVEIASWLAGGTAYLAPSPRPESLADVLDDANLPDELRARIEKAVGA